MLQRLGADGRGGKGRLLAQRLESTVRSISQSSLRTAITIPRIAHITKPAHVTRDP